MAERIDTMKDRKKKVVIYPIIFESHAHARRQYLQYCF